MHCEESNAFQTSLSTLYAPDVARVHNRPERLPRQERSKDVCSKNRFQDAAREGQVQVPIDVCRGQIVRGVRSGGPDRIPPAPRRRTRQSPLPEVIRHEEVPSTLQSRRLHEYKNAPESAELLQTFRVNVCFKTSARVPAPDVAPRQEPFRQSAQRLKPFQTSAE
ncbi:hypothetical protein WMY93_000912 [Mugilogobius chulae]|uniref:Uncharacterized protein n=1 Tax=Mugilogobius chulae TaxID=88201 RepID=A0AAW0QFK4_9GOBI